MRGALEHREDIHARADAHVPKPVRDQIRFLIQLSVGDFLSVVDDGRLIRTVIVLYVAIDRFVAVLLRQQITGLLSIAKERKGRLVFIDCCDHGATLFQ